MSKKKRDETGRCLASGRGEGASAARERTLSHVDRILRAATMTGAGLVVACGGSAAQDAPQVCDPLPPPVGCCENPEQFLLRGCLAPQARWAKVEERWVLELSLWVNVWPGRDAISFGRIEKAGVKVTGAALRDLKKEPSKLGLTLVPEKDRKQVDVELPVQCDEKTIPLRLTLDVSQPPEANGSVPVKLSN